MICWNILQKIPPGKNNPQKGNNCDKMPFIVAIKVFATKPEVTLKKHGKMIWGPHKRSYEDPIFQILSLYVFRFDLETLLKLIENI